MDGNKEGRKELYQERGVEKLFKDWKGFSDGLSAYTGRACWPFNLSSSGDRLHASSATCIYSIIIRSVADNPSPSTCIQ